MSQEDTISIVLYGHTNNEELNQAFGCGLNEIHYELGKVKNCKQVTIGDAYFNSPLDRFNNDIPLSVSIYYSPGQEKTTIKYTKLLQKFFKNISYGLSYTSMEKSLLELLWKDIRNDDVKIYGWPTML